MDDMEDTGTCDCGNTYDVGSRFDHNADTGECWDCSEMSMDNMTEEEWENYLIGNSNL